MLNQKCKNMNSPFCSRASANLKKPLIAAQYSGLLPSSSATLTVAPTKKDKYRINKIKQEKIQ